MVAIGDSNVRDLLRDLLEDDGYRVQAIPRPTRSVIIARARPDLIMLDLRLVAPMRGWRLLAALRALPATTHVPIIAFTADVAQLADYQAQLEAWRVQPLAQPFDIEDVLATVRSLLSA
jgi:two-component system cell cycle response regulator DivK